MSDLKKEELQEQTKNNTAKPRNYTFMGIAALYLIYLGYELCMGFINRKEGSSVGFLLIGIVFIGVGIAVVIYAVKGSRKRHEIMKAAEAAEAAAAAAEEKELAEMTEKAEEKKAVSRKMSIAERARMVENIEDEEEKAETED